MELPEKKILEKKNQGIEVIISLSKSLLLVRDRNQLAEVLKSQFSKMDFFDGGSEFIFNEQWLKDSPVAVDQQNNLPDIFKALSEPAEFALPGLSAQKKSPLFLKEWEANGGKKIVVVPVLNGSEWVGSIFLPSKKQEVSFIEHFGILNAMALQISAAVSNILVNEKIEHHCNEINAYRQQLEIENLYLQEEINTTHNYSEIIGTSSAMKGVFHLVSQVSVTNSSVLILGETGTGKELIARAIHNASARKDKVMVKVNCATLPANLIESELFGHERGSFTGATDRRIGKFELANNSTIFLDEIGELPLALQVKLLRALQEKEIERIGGKVTIKTDIRVIAATNRDLLKEVQNGNFRSDLYYRLNVFPIHLPSLRDRKEDIPPLAAHFLSKHAKKSKTNGFHFTSKAMKQLIAYNWPGNVREMEHLIERSILLAKGEAIHQVYLPSTDGGETNEPLQNSNVKTIDEIEREHIISVLKMVNGKVSGVGGAAEILKIPSTTLSSKILRLHIKKGVS